MKDTRMPRQHRVQTDGRIVFNEGRTMVSCVVQTLSDNGAVLQVHSVFGIPSAFKLTLGDQTQHSCWVTHKTAKEIRVAFTDWQPAVGPWDDCRQIDGEAIEG